MTRTEISIATRLIARLDEARDQAAAKTITFAELRRRHEAIWILIAQTSRAVQEAIDKDMRHRLNAVMAQERDRG